MSQSQYFTLEQIKIQSKKQEKKNCKECEIASKTTWFCSLRNQNQRYIDR